jgi:hypothetical protein
MRPSRPSTVTRMASGLGITWESARTGNESTIASAIPPSATTGTVGAAYRNSATAATTSATMPASTRARRRSGSAADPPRPPTRAPRRRASRCASAPCATPRATCSASSLPAPPVRVHAPILRVRGRPNLPKTFHGHHTPSGERLPAQPFSYRNVQDYPMPQHLELIRMRRAGILPVFYTDWHRLSRMLCSDFAECATGEVSWAALPRTPLNRGGRIGVTLAWDRTRRSQEDPHGPRHQEQAARYDHRARHGPRTRANSG